MIALIAAGIAVLVVVAIVVGIVDAAQATAWREIAAERRAVWEARRLAYHGIDGPDDAEPDGDEDDD